MNDITWEIVDGYLVIKVSGRIDGTNSDFFIDSVQALFEEHPEDTIIDCSGLKFISSGGITALLKLHQDCKKQNRKVALASVPSVILKVLTLVKLDQLLGFFDTPKEAITSFSR